MSEFIAGVAIRYEDGRVFSLPRPYRHHNLIRMMAYLGEPIPINGDQGFVTNKGRWLRRIPARVLAISSAQVPVDSSGPLFSEDVW